MKIFSIVCVVAVLLFPNLSEAQTAPNGQTTTLPPSTQPSIISRSANSHVWAWTENQQGPNGQTIPKVHQYTELASGLCYQKDGQWIDSQEQINIMPDGSAAAIQGQHQAYFPADIYNGVITLITPDGLQLQSEPVGLGYDDGTNTVLMAELTNSIGQLISPNQVIYTNAFVGLNADLLYTYTKAGFEQDVILNEQPQTPEFYGLNPQTACLQLMTEFLNPPRPIVTTTVIPAQAGLPISDDFLDFSAMKIVPGRAFLLGDNAEDGQAMVGKQWVSLQGRQFLVEEVPVNAISHQLSQLSPIQISSIKAGSPLNAVSSRHLLPAKRIAKASNGHRMRASTMGIPRKGLMLDYQAWNGTQTNFVFQGDTTYFISGQFNLWQTNTFEGGAVIKYTNGASISIVAARPNGIIWQATAYHPVIFTAKDDDSVGESLPGSTGNPTGYYANPALSPLLISGSAPTISYFRIAHAKQAISLQGSIIPLFYNGQIINCQGGFTVNGATTIYLRNILFNNVQTNLNNLFSAVFDIQNSTFASSTYLAAIRDTPFQGATLHFTNCIFENVTNLTNTYTTGPINFTINGSYNGFYSTPTFGSGTVTTNTYPFETAGAGNFYLTNDCMFRNAGTTNIDPMLISDLAQKTTWPPIIRSNITFLSAVAFSPVVQRDNYGVPDLGYHYDPIDYLCGGVCISNANAIVYPGTVIGCFGLDSLNTGLFFSLDIEGGGGLTCQGVANAPSRLVEYSTVQEGPPGNNWGTPSAFNPPILLSDFIQSSPTGAAFNFRFTDMSIAQDNDLWLLLNNGSINLHDCEIYGGLGLSTSTNVDVTNCLFDRVQVEFEASGFPSAYNVYNSLVYGGTFNVPNGSTNSAIFNNLFVQASSVGLPTNGGRNAYYWPPFTNTYFPTDILLTNAPVFQTGPFGNFYQATNGLTIYGGNTNASLLGLFHYTVMTNEIVDGTNLVSLGYHYVATDANGIPTDNNSDGIPDYLEDANGNGLVDSGEIGWNIVGDPGLKVIITHPRDGSTLP